MTKKLREILLARPRGFCAGVDRAIDIVQLALQAYPPPIYVRREIVHNRHVVEALRAKGAIFVDELDEIPDHATVIFSAHGISPAVREEAKRRGLRVIDATCPLVTKVHLEALRYAREGYTIFLVGQEHHDEVIGTTGEAPDRIVVVSTPDEVERFPVSRPDKVAYITQTTLSVDDTREIIEALRRRFPCDESVRFGLPHEMEEIAGQTAGTYHDATFRQRNPAATPFARPPRGQPHSSQPGAHPL